MRCLPTGWQYDWALWKFAFRNAFSRFTALSYTSMFMRMRVLVHHSEHLGTARVEETDQQHRREA